jgi:hypothetical protein
MTAEQEIDILKNRMTNMENLLKVFINQYGVDMEFLYNKGNYISGYPLEREDVVSNIYSALDKLNKE